MTEISTFNGKTSNAVASSTPTISYLELKGLYGDHLAGIEKSRQEIKNARGAIKSWCESLRFEENNPIGKEFGKEFEKEILRYTKEQINIGIQKTTYSSRISLIKLIHGFYLKQTRILSLPDNFSERVKHLFRVNNHTCKGFWRLHLTRVVSYANLTTWISGKKSPSPRKMYVVEMIEKHLQVPDGTLTSTLRLHQTIFKSPTVPVNRPLKKYRIFTPSIDDEFEGLVEFKSAVVPPFGMTRRRRSIWTGEEGEMPPSALLFKSFLGRFFGFCCLPADNSDPAQRGLGLNENDLSLALLTDAETVEKFVTVFLPARSNGKHNNGAFVFIASLMSFLRKDTGYLYQKPEFAAKLGMPDDVTAWQHRCLETRQRLNKIKEFIAEEKASGGRSFGFGRDPERPIKEILQSPRPMFYIMQMVKNMLADVEKMSNNQQRQAVLYRDLLLIAMLQANPLRARMFSEMKFDEHLTKQSDGSWWLTFKKHEFKNRHFLKSDYRVRVAPDIWHLIEQYKNKFRERFAGARKSSIVFLSSLESQPQYKMSTAALSFKVFIRTRQYIPNCAGFRAHAFRHIVTSDIIKSNPGIGFFLAAKVLHDQLETVEANYAHLKTSEYFEPYNTLFSDMWKSIKSTDSKPKDDLDNDQKPDAEGGEPSED